MKKVVSDTLRPLLALIVILTAVFVTPLIITSASFFAIIVWTGITERDHLSDKALIENLEKDLAKYEQLIAMFREDSPTIAIRPNRIYPENVISDGRWNQYLILFQELKLDGGMASSGNGDNIEFRSTTKGFVFGGSIKGYVYKPEDPQPLYPSLNRIPEGLESTSGEAYKKINNEWYIYYSWH